MKKKLSFVLFLLVILFSFIEKGLNPSIPSLPGDPPSLHSSQAGDRLHDTYISAILSGKESVDFMIYTLKDAKIIQALNEASKKVKVKVIYDAEASKDVHKLLAREIVQIPRKSSGLMHLKILIIDKHDVWLGSTNMTREALKNHANLVAHIDCPGFSEVINEKCQLLSEEGFERPISPLIFKIEQQEIELRFLPDDKTAVDKIKNMINTAEKSVRVAMYTFTRRDFAYCLAQAHKRGVKVEVVIDKTTAKNTSKKIADYLKRQKIPVILSNKGGMMHHKFVLIDDKILAHGSANWTIQAFKQNDDYIMIIGNLSQAQKEVLHAVWSSLKEAA